MPRRRAPARTRRRRARTRSSAPPAPPPPACCSIGFRGTLRDTPFLKRLAAIPYGGLLLTENNYEQPQQLSGLTSKLQEVAREASHPAPLVAAQQEGGEFNAFGNLAPDGQVDVGEGSREAIASSAKTTAEQLKALGVGVNLAPNADVAVAGGPGQGRAFSNSPAKVASAVKATVRAVQRGRRGGGRRPVPGDRRGIAGPERRPGAGRALARGPARGRPQAVRGRGRRSAIARRRCRCPTRSTSPSTA